MRVCIIAIVVALLAGSGLTYCAMTRGGEDIQRIEAQNDSLTNVLSRREAQVRDLQVERERLMVKAAEDSAAADSAKREAERLASQVGELEEARNEAGADLAEYLADDPTGMELLRRYDAEWTALVDLKDRLIETLRTENEHLASENLSLRDALRLSEREADLLRSSVTDLSEQNQRLIEQLRIMDRKLHPGFAVKLIRDLPQKVIWAGIGYGVNEMVNR